MSKGTNRNKFEPIVPDVVNYAWREYGLRVGLWRIADVLDAAGIKATIALNSLVCEHYPRAMEEMKKRGWEFMGHGTTNSVSLAGLSLDKERETIRTILKTIEQSAGRRPRGWLGSGLAETYNTLDILAEEGVNQGFRLIGEEAFLEQLGLALEAFGKRQACCRGYRLDRLQRSQLALGALVRNGGGRGGDRGGCLGVAQLGRELACLSRRAALVGERPGKGHGPG